MSEAVVFRGPSLWRVFVMSAWLALICQGALAQTDGDGRHGTFKDVQGQVRVDDGSQLRLAAPGAGVKQGDRILTGHDGAATVTLRDGTVMTVGPDSQATLAQFQFEPTRQEGSVVVNLLEGTLRMITGLVAKTQPQNVKVNTPTTVVGIRGTDFIVEAH